MVPGAYNDTTATKPNSDRDQKIVDDTLREFSEMHTYRVNFATQWEEVARLVLPEYSNTFMFGSYNFPGMKKTWEQIDASGMMALHRFGAICDSLLTPRNMMWHQLSANDPNLMKDRATQLWFEDTTNRLFKYRYAPSANFSGQNQAVWQSLGAFGNATMFIEPLYSLRGERGLRYKAVPLGEMFYRENHQGQIDGFIRWFRMTAQQAYKEWPDTFPEALRPALERFSQTPFNFYHRVCPRDDYDPERLDYRGKLWASYYVCAESKTVLEEGGYNSFPAPTTRYSQAPGEVYGRGPAMMVLPALKTLNAEKRVFLKSGHRAADPVLLTADDGLMNFSLRPGAMNPGGMSPDGHALVGVLPTGNIQITKEMMDEERGLINDAFLVSLFQILEETPQMSATEVIERVNEKGILIAPTMGRQQSEYLGPTIDRELDVLSQQGLLAPMPPALKEARGEYSVTYTSPLAKAVQAQEASGFMRTLQTVQELIQITQDPAPLDNFNFDVAIPAIADIQSVPASWMASSDDVAAKRQSRAKQQQVQQQIQAAPAAAAMLKAKVAAAQGGVPMGGQNQPQQPQPAIGQ